MMSRPMNVLMPAAGAFVELISEMKRDGKLALGSEFQKA
jgi:hypothetical protein